MWSGLPSIVPLHLSQTPQVSQHSPHHARNTRNTLQEDEPCEPLFLCHFEFRRDLLARGGMAISCYSVHTPSHYTDSTERHPVRPIFRLPVSDWNLAHLFISIARKTVSIIPSNHNIVIMGWRVKTYTGWDQDDTTSWIWSAFGGGKYSLFWSVGVDATYRLLVIWWCFLLAVSEAHRNPVVAAVLV